MSLIAFTTLGLDVGSERSAYAVLSPSGTLLDYAKLPNEELLSLFRYRELCFDVLVVEMTVSYGKPVGQDVHLTTFWTGRLVEACGREHRLVLRKDVKRHLCDAGSGVTDAMIRQRLIDLWGGRERAIGRKKAPGPLYGVRADEWQALGVAVYGRHLLEREASAA